jgi:hypothetical protein
MPYSYGIPGYVIWSHHILFGLFLIYLGYTKKITDNIGKLLILIGVIMMIYHLHLMIKNRREDFVYGSSMYHGSEFLHTSYLDNSDMKDKMKFTDLKPENKKC